MAVYGSQTEDDVADRGRCNTHTQNSFIAATAAHTLIVVSVSGRPGSYLDPKVLVPPPQQGVHVLQHQLGGGVQKVKVQVETQQRRSVHLLERATNTRLTLPE